MMRRWSPLPQFLLLFVLTWAVLTVVTAGSRAHFDAPAPTLLLQDRHGDFLAEVGAGRDDPRGYWPVEPLPERVVAATIAIEDRRFYGHPGVDLRGVARAVVQNARSGRVVSGASTLAMQVARMQDPGGRTLPKKSVEALTALLLTARYGREGVLQQYLRLVPYGNRVRGIAYASRRYLDKPVQDLSWAETAFLCAIPQSPSAMDPYDREGRERAIARGERILVLLHQRGLMSDAELAQAQGEIAQIAIPPRQPRPVLAMHPILQLEEQLEDGELRQRLARDNPVVRTTLDLELQGRVQGHVHAAMRRWRARGAGNAAVMVIDRATGEVHAQVGSALWGEDDAAGAYDYTRVSRLPGSTLKPFVYAAALERGVLGPGTVLDDLGRGPDAIRNADDRFLGPLLPRRALGNSRNVPAVLLVQQVGLREVHEHFRQLGLHDGSTAPETWGLGVAIGGMPVTMQTLARAYLTLASGEGRLEELTWVPRAETPTRPLSVYRPETAALVQHWLGDPMARLPTFPRLGLSEYPFPVAVKTGTSPQYRDSWTVAWSEQWLVLAWVGHPDYRPMQRLSGYRAAGELVHRVLTDLHEHELDGLSDHPFPLPEGAEAVRVCPLTGDRATEACDGVVDEYFLPGTEPTHDCSAHVRLVVDAATGQPAELSTPAERAVERTFLDLPPQYAAWQAREGLLPPPTRLEVGALSDDTPITLTITQPQDGTQHLADPESPGGTSTVPFEVTVDPPVEQVVWYVDGEPVQVVDAPYSWRWPLAPGEHTIEVGLPFTEQRSAPVTIRGG